MQTSKNIAVWTAFLLASSVASAQGQPNTKDSRHVGLDLLSVVQAPGGTLSTPGGVTLTVHAPAGSTYDVILETSLGSADYSLPYVPLVGPFTSPPSSIHTTYFHQAAAGPPAGFPTAFSFPIGAAFTDPNGNAVGTIPVGQTSQTLVSTFQLPAGTPTNFQALVADPNGPVVNYYLTNGQQRFAMAQPTGLATSGFTTNAGAVTSGQVKDIEQGDLDGDGDLDEAIIGVPANGWTFSRISYPIGSPVMPPVRTNTVYPMGSLVDPTSAEFVDLNNDGYLDFVIGGSDSTPGSPAPLTSKLRVFLSSGAGGGLLAPFPLTVTFEAPLATVPMNIADLETADFNGDGLPDVYVACGSPLCNVAEMNRIFMGTMTGTVYSLVEQTTAWGIASYADDSEDCEVIDFQNDMLPDIVVGNYDGGAFATNGNGANTVYYNPAGFGMIALPLPGPAVETSDITVADFNQDGFEDIYVGNFLATNAACTPSSSVPDNLLLFNPTLGYWTDNSSLIPSNNWATTDVESVRIPASEIAANGLSQRDFDGDGDIDIFIALGARGQTTNAVLPGFPGINRGVIVLVNQLAGSTPGSPFPSFVLDRSYAGTEDLLDIELGDWVNSINVAVPPGRWFEKDLGMGTWASGSAVSNKNP